jgi:hypothetical protein
MSLQTHWRNATVYQPIVNGWYEIEVGKFPNQKKDRGYWDGRAWRRSSHTCDQFVRIHHVLRFCLRARDDLE